MICGLWLISSSLTRPRSNLNAANRKNFSGDASSAVRQLEGVCSHMREKVFAKREGAHLLKLLGAEEIARNVEQNVAASDDDRSARGRADRLAGRAIDRQHGRAHGPIGACGDS